MNEAVVTLAEATVERRDATGDVEPAAAHPERPSLTERLPGDVFTEHAALLAGYRSYPVFSAPWFWGRTKVFGPLAAAMGLAETLMLGLEIHDGRLGLLYAMGDTGFDEHDVIVAIEEAYAAEMGGKPIAPEARRTPAKPKRTVARKAPRKTSKKAQNKTTKRKKR